ncbi:MAG: HesA/MoeB/ThiF family protein [Muribaculaceae bacterium]
MESDKDLRERYSRQMILPQMGDDGQRKLAEGSVLLVGAGGLGSPAGLYLAAAGVGRIGIADGDVVSRSNLARQVAHFTSDLGRKKVDSMSEKLRAINPNVELTLYDRFIDRGSAQATMAGYDFIIDCTDSLCSKYMINDACVELGKPCCIGGVFRFGAQLLTVVPGSACYRCVFPDASPTEGEMSCAISGVMGGVVGMLGCLQAVEAVKHLAGIGSLLTDRLLTADTLTMQFHTVAVARDPHCPTCSRHHK